MKCPKCHTENIADALFCEECRAPLEVACPSCGAGNRKHLADKILQSGSALEIAETLELIQRTDVKGLLHFVLLERAGLARLRGDKDGMARDLAEARGVFAQMGVTGCDDYARSIEA